jgi:hypothetical protein
MCALDHEWSAITDSTSITINSIQFARLSADSANGDAVIATKAINSEKHRILRCRSLIGHSPVTIVHRELQSIPRPRLTQTAMV